MGKRGQAAMEFLMTYGWALLIVLVAIGALAFFGVLNPAKFLPEQCVLGTGLACSDFGVTGKGFINLKITNGIGKNLALFTIHVAKKTDTSDEVCGGFIGYAAVPRAVGEIIFRDGETKDIAHNYKNGIYDVGPGINCDNTGIHPIVNCCSILGQVLDPPLPLCSNTLNCAVSSPVPKVGSRFKEDIIINFREVGTESILHQRIGFISTAIEE